MHPVSPKGISQFAHQEEDNYIRRYKSGCCLLLGSRGLPKKLLYFCAKVTKKL